MWRKIGRLGEIEYLKSALFSLAKTISALGASRRYLSSFRIANPNRKRLVTNRSEALNLGGDLQSDNWENLLFLPEIGTGTRC